MLAEAFGDLGDAAARVDLGEVPLEDEVAVPERRRLSPDLQVAEELLELVGAVQVVVVGERLQPQRLAETARTQEDENAAQPLDVADVGRPVDVVQTLPADAVKIGDAVGELHHAHSVAQTSKGTAAPGFQPALLLGAPASSRLFNQWLSFDELRDLARHDRVVADDLRRMEDILENAPTCPSRKI